MKRIGIFCTTLFLILTSGCSSSVKIYSMDGYFEYEANTKEEIINLFETFFNETTTHTNQTIKYTLKTVVSGVGTFVEQIDGTNNCVERNYDGDISRSYSFVLDDKYYFAQSIWDSKEYTVNKDKYDNNYFTYKHTVGSFKKLTFTEDISASCSLTGNGEYSKNDNNYYGNATFILDIKYNGSPFYYLKGTSKNNLINHFDYSFLNTTDHRTWIESELNVTYGSASVTIPDISNWQRF